MSFLMLKEALISAPIMQAPDWVLSFEVICNVNNYTLRLVLGQQKDNKPHIIYYESKTLDVNYATTEKEFLEVVFALEKFHSYLINSKMMIFTDHAALKHL